MKSALFYLRGRAFEALENRQKAAQWYQKAVVADVHCFEVYLSSNNCTIPKIGSFNFVLKQIKI